MKSQQGLLGKVEHGRRGVCVGGGGRGVCGGRRGGVDWDKPGFDQTPALTLDALIKWPMSPCLAQHPARDRSRCFLGVPQSGRAV